MRYLSLFSGIEAASCAWQPLGWEAVAFAEIDPFCSDFLRWKYPETENLGDVENAYNWGPIDANVVVGGSPCQSFSVAGKRLGLEDPRGNLALEFLRVVGYRRPRWFVYENVPGLLRSNGGWDLGTFLREVARLGYGWAYRVLDSRYFGVPQRRRRLFIVGHRGDWRPAVEALFEPESLRRPAETVPIVARGPSVRAYTIYPFSGQGARLTASPAAYATGLTAVALGSLTERGTRIVDERGVRRLSLTEVERCFGFPDHYTAMPGASDTARYKALGNSMAVPVMRWIGERISVVDSP